jgi:transposase, IS5 family
MKAQKRIYRLAFNIYYDLVVQLNPILKQKYLDLFNTLYRILTQKREDTNKVYSFREPELICIGIGKEHKPYEFGHKNSFDYTRKSDIIPETLTVEGNVFDGHTLEPQLQQVKRFTNGKITIAIVDRS